jgi:hypothetical protein
MSVKIDLDKPVELGNKVETQPFVSKIIVAVP